MHPRKMTGMSRDEPESKANLNASTFPSRCHMGGSSAQLGKYLGNADDLERPSWQGRLLGA